MAEVLSQSQIDALLNAAFSGEALTSQPEEKQEDKKYRKYDFNSPRKFTKDRIKMLNGIFENYSRIVNTRINGLLHTTCEVEVESVEEQRYYEFSNALTDGAVLTIAYLNMKGKTDDSPVLMYVTTPVMVSMMDRMMGGDGQIEVDFPDDYTYTNLDLRLYESLMRDFVSVMGGSWENYINLDFEYERVEVNPTLVQLVGLDETVVLVDLNLKFQNCEGRMSICLPGMMLTNIFTEMSLETPVKRSSSEDSSQRIFDNLRDTSLEIIAELGRTTLRLQDIYDLNVGDVVNLNQKKDSPVYLRIGGQRWFEGLMGVSEKQIAIKVKQVYNAERKGNQGNGQ
ncbi:MAG: flagellar motor switch protein FliM [Clostridia bacterium]|nr:flagellar motor switch protein FliM [Clostridia bacterium]